MSEDGRKSDAPAPEGAGPPEAGTFRWQSFFQHARQPLFVLNRQRRLLFVNRAWETLTGIPAVAARGLICTRRRAVGLPHEAVTRALAPPAEALVGTVARVRRLLPSGACWDIDFFPLQADSGLRGVLGQIRVVSSALEPVPLAAGLTELHERARRARSKDATEESFWQPEALLALRQRVVERHCLDDLDGELPALRRVAEQVRLVGGSLLPVLLVGEAGVGKQWLARTIHYRGSTAELPVAALDCRHLPPPALAAVLFGEVLPYRFGTLYLNGLNHLPLDLQARLCDRLAATADPPRLIAGLRADPEEEARAGRLLEELHGTLSTVVIRLPPLRERRADLPRLAERLLTLAAEGGPVPAVTADAWEVINAYPWPGNLRELQAALLQARARAGARIEAAHLPAYLRRAVRLGQTPGRMDARPLPLDRLLEEAERRLILLALERAGGKKWKAADLLEIPRPRLFRRMKALGLQAGQEADAEEMVAEGEVQIDEAEE